MMRWLDAAEKVLRDVDTQFHYVDLAEQILKRDLVDTQSQTPAITLHASLSLDIKSRTERGLPPRFVMVRGGMVSLAEWEGGPLEDARDALLESRDRAKRDLLKKLRQLDGGDFETFLERLFTQMGYDVTVTGGSDDDGIDLVAELVDAGIGNQRVGIQAKCKGAPREIGPNTIRLLRDGLAGYKCNVGAVVATVRFNDKAVAVAEEVGKPPVDLIDHDRLIELALRFGVGVRAETIEVYSEDLDSIFSDEELGS